MLVRIQQHVNPNCNPHSLDKKHSIGVKNTHYFFFGVASGLVVFPGAQKPRSSENWGIGPLKKWDRALACFPLICFALLAHVDCLHSPSTRSSIQNYGSSIAHSFPQCPLLFGITSMLAAQCTMKNVICFLNFISFTFETDSRLQLFSSLNWIWPLGRRKMTCTTLNIVF